MEGHEADFCLATPTKLIRVVEVSSGLLAPHLGDISSKGWIAAGAQKEN